MDNQRLFLYLGLGLILMLIWQQWQLDQRQKHAPAVAQTQSEVPRESEAPQVPAPAGGAASVESTGGAEVPSLGGDTQPTAEQSGQRVILRTDVLELSLSTTGADVREAKLLDYPVSLEEPDRATHLLTDNPVEFFISQSGLQASSGSAPDHHAEYAVESNEFVLADGSDELRVPFVWTGEDGVRVTKTYLLRRDSYAIDVQYTIDNGSGETWQGSQYRQMQHRGLTDDEGPGLTAYSYTGGVISTDETRYEKIDFDDMRDENLQLSTSGGWVAMIRHYFIGAWAPSADERNTIYSKALRDSNRYILGMFSAAQSIEPGQSGSFATALYIGPKIQERLEQVATHLHLTVDFGYLTFIADPIFWLLKQIHDFVGNWGFAIILVTVMIKAVFYKLSEASYRSMARMRKLQPKIQQLKERHGDDREKMGRATMELYKTEKVNPLGGCFPILIQIPVFISLYWVLLESVELRQAPFILWWQDLSVKDPYFVLPLVMGATMFIQQRLNPAPVDPIQAKIFMAMPVVFTAFFAFFPQGLVLYWVVNNTLSISQQYYITRHVLAEK